MRMKEKFDNPEKDNQEQKNIYINCPSSKILETIKKFSISTYGKENMDTKPKYIKEEHSKLNLWKITSRLLLVGQLWDSNTEYITHRNSITDVQEYLENHYKEYTLFLTTSNMYKNISNVHFIDKIDYDCEFIIKICCGIQTWYELNEDNVAVIEINYQYVTFFAILIECILIYIKKQIRNSIYFQENEILKLKLFNLNTVIRYKNYFYNLSCKKSTDKLELLILHQVIISNYPRFEAFSKFRILLQIYKRNEKVIMVREIDDIEIVYKDEFYIVLTNINAEVNGDIVLSLYFLQDNLEKKIFEFPLNGFYYTQGLYRYKKDDILTSYGYKFQEEFKFDLVFLDSQKSVHLNYLDSEIDMIQGLKVLSKMNIQEEDKSRLESFINLGYNRIVAKFCAIMKYTDKKALDLINVLERKGYNNLISNCRPLQYATIKFKNDSSKPETIKTSFQESIVRESIDREKLYKNLRIKDFKLIEPIKEEDLLIPVQKKISKKVIFKKKELKKEDYQDIDYRSLRPLHWVPIVSTEETIFKNLDFYDTKLDKEKFKKYFCVKNTGVISTIQIDIKNNAIVIEPKRLFLVTLALKHLNKKNINPENIYEILKHNAQSIFIQDLLNLENVFPTYEENYLLATCDYDKLGPDEKIMLEYSKLVEVKKIVKILLFERKFFDEIFLIEDLLEKIKFTFDKLLNSQEIKIILKTFLDIGNMINYEYSIRKKRLAGFKLSSIYLFLDYKGNEDFSLFDYFMDSLEYKNLLVNLQRDFRYIDIIRKEQFSKIREKINYYINQFMNNLDVYLTLENDKETFKNFLVFVSDKLENIKQKYEDCANKTNQIKKLFDESDQKNIIEVLDCLAVLINKMVNYKKSKLV
jgi:hypothetical protein